GERRYAGLARGALAATRRQLAHAGETVASPGAFDGWGGVIYTLAHLGALWQAPGLWDEAEALLDHLPAALESDLHLDVIAGAAGCAAALLALNACRPSARLLRLVELCADRL